MPLDIFSEQPLNLSEAVALLPPLMGGRRVHVTTLRVWIRHGLGGVRLEALKLGRAWVTSREALLRFGERLTRQEVCPSATPIPDGHRVALAEREAERRGL